jgi:hypothetical protein
VLTVSSTGTGTNNAISKTGGTTNNNQVDNAALSDYAILSGDGYLEFKVSSAIIGPYGSVGLANDYLTLAEDGAIAQSTGTIWPKRQFAILLGLSTMYITMGNTSVAANTGINYGQDDSFRIQIIGNEVAVLRDTDSLGSWVEVCRFGDGVCGGGGTTQTLDYPYKILVSHRHIGADVQEISLQGANLGVPAPPAVCGSDDSTIQISEPTNLCDVGTPSAVTDNGETWDWTCTSLDVVNCSAVKLDPGNFIWETRFNTSDPITVSSVNTGTNNRLQKTGGAANFFDNLYRSTQTLTSGDGKISFILENGGTSRFTTGFRDSTALPANDTLDQAATWTDLKYGVAIFSGQIYSVRNNAAGFLGAVPADGSLIEVKITGGGTAAGIYVDQVLLYDFGVAPTDYPYHVHYNARIDGSVELFATIADAPPSPVCGSDNGGTFLTEPTNLCDVGTASAVTNNTTTWDWTCTSGTVANCQATVLNQFTAFPSQPARPDSILTKGNLLAHDGTRQEEFPACSDGQRLEWDAAAEHGFKCITPSTTTLVGARVWGAENSVGTGETKVNFQTLDFESGGATWDAVNRRITVPSAGKYQFSAAISGYEADTIDDTWCYAEARVNGSAAEYNGSKGYEDQPPSTNIIGARTSSVLTRTSSVLTLSASDYVEVWARCSKSITFTVTDTSIHFELYKIGD